MKRIVFLIALLSIICGVYVGKAVSAGNWYEAVPLSQSAVDYGDRTDGQPVYVGWSQYGKADSDYAWAIIKIIYNVDGTFKEYVFANGNALPSKSWVSRATYTYTTSD
jgi:hypothetical protein